MNTSFCNILCYPLKCGNFDSNVDSTPGISAAAQSPSSSTQNIYDATCAATKHPRVSNSNYGHQHDSATRLLPVYRQPQTLPNYDFVVATTASWQQRPASGGTIDTSSAVTKPRSLSGVVPSPQSDDRLHRRTSEVFEGELQPSPPRTTTTKELVPYATTATVPTTCRTSGDSADVALQNRRPSSPAERL